MQLVGKESDLSTTDQFRTILTNIIARNADSENVYAFFNYFRTLSLTEDEFEALIEEVAGKILPWNIEVQFGNRIFDDQEQAYLVTRIPNHDTGEYGIALINMGNGFVHAECAVYEEGCIYTLLDLLKTKENCWGYRQ